MTVDKLSFIDNERLVNYLKIWLKYFMWDAMALLDIFPIMSHHPEYKEQRWKEIVVFKKASWSFEIYLNVASNPFRVIKMLDIPIMFLYVTPFRIKQEGYHKYFGSRHT